MRWRKRTREPLCARPGTLQRLEQASHKLVRILLPAELERPAEPLQVLDDRVGRHRQAVPLKRRRDMRLERARDAEVVSCIARCAVLTRNGVRFVERQRPMDWQRRMQSKVTRRHGDWRGHSAAQWDGGARACAWARAWAGGARSKRQVGEHRSVREALQAQRRSVFTDSDRCMLAVPG